MHLLTAMALLIQTPVAQGPVASPEPPADAPKRISPSKIVLVGDSTTAVMGGWGPSFCAHHVTSFVACVNLARGGRSTSNYRLEGSWDIALSEMGTRGYRDIWVLIQFGHNDQPGKPGRSTDLAIEFPANLARYVDEVRAAGAHPVLVTPLTRRTFIGGVLQRDLDPWAAATRKVAVAKQVPLLDLNAESSAAVQAMGEEAADRFAQLPKDSAPIVPAPATATEIQDLPMAQHKLAFDRTHLGPVGADYFARMVTRELAAALPALRPALLP